MADIGKLIDDVLRVARTVTQIIPGTADDAVVGIAGKVVEIIDSLADQTPDTRTQQQMQADRKALAAAVSAKAERTADRFDS